MIIFLFFSAEEISLHINLLQELSLENPLTIRLKREENTVSITLVGYDQKGAFSVICGLISMFGIEIDSGASYTYLKKKSSKNAITTNSFYRRSYSFNYNMSFKESNVANRKKIVCFIKANFKSKHYRKDFNEKAFKAKLLDYFLRIARNDWQTIKEEICFYTVKK